MTRQQSAAIIAAQITLLRSQRGLTTAELAKRVGSSSQHVHAHLAGRRTPTVHALVEYARALNVKPSELVACLDGVK